jgi:hypothetical protein
VVSGAGGSGTAAQFGGGQFEGEVVAGDHRLTSKG